MSRRAGLPVGGRSRWRTSLELLALFVGVATGFVSLATDGGASGLRDVVWRNWFVAWTFVLAALVATLLALAAAWIRRPSACRVGRVMSGLGAMAVAVAALDGLRTRRVVGCGLVGFTLSTVVMLRWLTGWITARKRAGGETTLQSLERGFERWGRWSAGPLHRLASQIAKGPRVDRGPEVRRELDGTRAVTAGVVVVVFSWVAVASLGWVSAYAVTGRLRPKALEDAPAPQAPPETRRSSGAMTNPSTTPTSTAPPATPVPGASLTCSYRAGVGLDVPRTVEAAAATVLVEAVRRFLVCPTGLMSWRPSTGVFQQEIFTYDGEGAALVVWDDGDKWVTVFVSSDDAAAYRAVSPSLDWTALGRPLPFMRCDGLWVQPFVQSDHRVTGLGVRDREDVERRADQPFYVWGSTVEVLLGRGAKALRLPVGGPTADAGGPVQHFVRGEMVRSPHAPAERLTVERLVKHCSR